MSNKTRFVGYPSAVLYALDDPDTTKPPPHKKALKHLLWGDELAIQATSADGEFHRVKVRGEHGWIADKDTQSNRLLEIVFVDIGQGDGALIITPDNRKYVLDAGEDDNMYRFLRWRFSLRKTTTFDAAIMSHSDMDHYGGFEKLFADPNVKFKTVYTNGIMERYAESDTDILGPRVKHGSHTYITDLIPDLQSLKALLSTMDQWEGRKKFPSMLDKGLNAGSFSNYRMLDVSDKYLPGHESGETVEFEILGPVTEKVNGKKALRWFGNPGRTKNGHSIVFRLRMNNVTVFMGGDLNIESSRLLLEHHTGLSAQPTTAEGEVELVTAARPFLGCDVAKACHHGSADTLLPFIKSLNPAATVISSGDDESYAHPRADAIGAIGKSSRGDRPLVLSTELARSAKEVNKYPSALRKQLHELIDSVQSAGTEAAKKKAKKKADEFAIKHLGRSIAVYGAINLRTDGTRVVMAYKMERSTATKGWDIYSLEPVAPGGPLVYRSKHDD